MIVSQPLFRAMREGMAWIVRRRRRVGVTGRSMLPTLADGEFVLVDPNRGPLTGQLVVAYHPERTELMVVKRVIDHNDNGYVLASDNPDEGTDSRTWGRVRPDHIVGVVTLILDRPTTGPDLSGHEHRH